MAAAAAALSFLLFLGMFSYSDAVYCVCNSGLSDAILQTNIDYACSHADCSAILQTGPCFNPNTVRDHCNYAVNSFYQRSGQVAGSCGFSGTATVTQTPPTASPGCVYPSSPSTGAVSGPPAATTPTGTTPPGVTGGAGPLSPPGATLSPPGLAGTGGSFPGISPPGFTGSTSSSAGSSGRIHVLMLAVTSCFAHSLYSVMN